MVALTMDSCAEGTEDNIILTAVLSEHFDMIVVSGGDASGEASVSDPRLGPVRDVELHLSTQFKKLLGSQP